MHFSSWPTHLHTCSRNKTDFEILCLQCACISATHEEEYSVSWSRYHIKMSSDTEPPRRSGHLAVHVDNCILVIGGVGWDDKRLTKPLSSRLIWMYNLHTEQWKKHVIPNTKTAPCPIYAGIAVVIGKDIYTFGGWELKRKTETNALWKLSKNRIGCFFWHNIKHQCKEDTPSPRMEHSGWEFAGQLWAFGGFGKSPTGYLNNHGYYRLRQGYGENNQILCYDFHTEKWSNPQCFGDIPVPRKDHATTIIDDSVWLFGGSAQDVFNPHRTYISSGFFQLNMNTLTWTRIHTGHTNPQGRAFGTLTPVRNNELVLHGSFSDMSPPNNIVADTWVMDLTSHAWRLHSSRKDHVRIRHTAS